MMINIDVLRWSLEELALLEEQKRLWLGASLSEGIQRGQPGWEDDPVQSSYPEFEGGANELSLNQARTSWEKELEGKHDQSNYQ